MHAGLPGQELPKAYLSRVTRFAIWFRSRVALLFSSEDVAIRPNPARPRRSNPGARFTFTMTAVVVSALNSVDEARHLSPETKAYRETAGLDGNRGSYNKDARAAKKPHTNRP